MKRLISLLVSTTLVILVAPAAPHGSQAVDASSNRSPSGRTMAVSLPTSSAQRRQIRTQQVVTANVPGDEIVAPGRIILDPRRVGRVLLPVPGRVDRVSVRVGDTVRAGQPLLTLDSPEAEAAIAECRQSQAALNQTAAALHRVQGDLDRLRDLLEHKAVANKEVLHAEEDLAQAQGAHIQAEAAWSQTSRRLEILGLEPGARGQQVVVRAPLSGKVLEVAVTSGEYRTDTNSVVMTIADLTTVLVSSDVAERDIRLVEVGEGVSVELVAYPGQSFEARVTRISDTVDARTRSIQVQADIANPQGLLRPEMYGRIRHSHASRPLPVVPPQALIQSATGPFVFVERTPGTFERTPVVPGGTSGGQVAILDGLRAGDHVVVDGAMLLRSSQPGEQQ